MNTQTMTQLIIILCLLPFTLVGCSSMPGALEGNDLSHLSLRDKRMADKKVKVLAEQPKASNTIGQVTSKRCQSSMFSEAPEEKTLLVDMKAEAYRLGANAISDVKFQQQGAMGAGCWNVFTATANMLVIE
jgi:uncharacterized protein YbjQ (UPF0145 family)